MIRPHATDWYKNGKGNTWGPARGGLEEKACSTKPHPDAATRHIVSDASHHDVLREFHAVIT